MNFFIYVIILLILLIQTPILNYLHHYYNWTFLSRIISNPRRENVKVLYDLGRQYGENYLMVEPSIKLSRGTCARERMTYPLPIQTLDLTQFFMNVGLKLDCPELTHKISEYYQSMTSMYQPIDDLIVGCDGDTLKLYLDRGDHGIEGLELPLKDQSRHLKIKNYKILSSDKYKEAIQNLSLIDLSLLQGLHLYPQNINILYQVDRESIYHLILKNPFHLNKIQRHNLSHYFDLNERELNCLKPFDYKVAIISMNLTHTIQSLTLYLRPHNWLTQWNYKKLWFRALCS